jgi:hypothetical protein
MEGGIIHRIAAMAIAVGALAGPARAADGVRAAWVELGENGRAIARVITTAPACPRLTLDGADRALAMRAAAGTIAQRPTRSAPEDSKPSAFPVATCETELPASARHAVVAGIKLALPTPSPRLIVVIGDTGCRIKQSDNAYQPCNDADAWPFKAVADRAARLRPDLVIHVGDIHYRENKCAVEPGCAGSPWGYGYDTFEADFFVPAAKLLAAAPWVFVRGNHENCDRAGQGWWRFFDPRPLVRGRDCDHPGDDAAGDFSEPYAVPLGVDAQLVVFDSARVGNRALAAGDSMLATYTAQLEAAGRLARQRPTTFFLVHHPVLGFAPKPERDGAIGYFGGNAGLQSAMAAVSGTALLPETVQAVISGHNHLFQVTGFASDHPAQLIAGNAGSWSDSPNYERLPPGATPYPAATVAQSVSTNQYGFTTLARDGAAWLITAYDRTGRPLTTCTLAGRQARCDAAQLANANR